MIKRIVFSFLALAILSTVSVAQKSHNLTSLVILNMPEGDGSNGAAVAWHPKLKKYYAAFAGNAEFPLAVFAENGNRESEDYLLTDADVRGLWFANGNIEGNGYDAGGWFRYVSNENGIPTGIETFASGQHQPDPHSAGSFDPKGKMVYFMKTDGKVYGYKHPTAVAENTITLHLGQTKDSESAIPINNYNYTSLIYTGQKKAEFALLNHKLARVEYYNKKNGYMTGIAKFPLGTKAPDFLNFAYANGYFFIFEKNSRRWVGYK